MASHIFVLSEITAAVKFIGGRLPWCKANLMDRHVPCMRQSVLIILCSASLTAVPGFGLGIEIVTYASYSSQRQYAMAQDWAHPYVLAKIGSRMDQVLSASGFAMADHGQ